MQRPNTMLYSFDFAAKLCAIVRYTLFQLFDITFNYRISNKCLLLYTVPKSYITYETVSVCNVRRRCKFCTNRPGPKTDNLRTITIGQNSVKKRGDFNEQSFSFYKNNTKQIIKAWNNHSHSISLCTEDSESLSQFTVQ